MCWNSGARFIRAVLLVGWCVLSSAVVLSDTRCGRGDISKGVVEGDGKPAIRVGGVLLKVEIADTPLSRQRGLMFRENLPEDEGMLFVFERVDYLSFWMKNTLIPLSIAFIDAEGKIVQMEDMEPLDEQTHHRSVRPALYALEVNQGWFERHGVQIGDRVEFGPSPSI